MGDRAHDAGSNDGGCERCGGLSDKDTGKVGERGLPAVCQDSSGAPDCLLAAFGGVVPHWLIVVSHVVSGIMWTGFSALNVFIGVYGRQ